MIKTVEDTEILDKIGKILTRIKEIKPKYNEITDICRNYGANDFTEIDNICTIAEFFTNTKDYKYLSFKCMFYKVPLKNPNINTIRLSDTCKLSAYITCFCTQRKEYRIVHKGERLALV